ncbi:MAG TPA: FAD-binding oxidoreductase [Gammaproteobacteria bacterium]|nr:FAD-binding oxidoreductase [Gammaproteobacteria bacterium]
MTHIDLLPQDDSTNGWNNILPPRNPNPPLTDTVSPDWVVVGAGFAGLAAARRLAENRPQDQIILLEAQNLAGAASGRNAGFAIDLPHGQQLQDELSVMPRHIRLARSAIDYLQQQIDTHSIECQWSSRGQYHGTVSAHAFRTEIEPFTQVLDQLGESYRLLDRQQLADEIGTSYYHGALYAPGAFLMNPAALVRGLGDSQPENVTIYENSPVITANYGGKITLTTPNGCVRAQQLILGTGIYTEEFGFYKRSLLPIALSASLSRSLTIEEQKALGGQEDWGLTPVGMPGVTMRYTQDHRLLIRQKVEYGPGCRRSDAYRTALRVGHQACFNARFPMLPEVTIEHTWTGFVCVAQNQGHGFGKVADNIHSAICQNGIGVTKGTISGLLAADLACSRDNPLISDLQSLGTPNRLPPQPFLGLGVRANLAWRHWTGRAEK